MKKILNFFNNIYVLILLASFATLIGCVLAIGVLASMPYESYSSKFLIDLCLIGMASMIVFGVSVLSSSSISKINRRLAHKVLTLKKKLK
jgi:uncharacterized membrane protein